MDELLSIGKRVEEEGQPADNAPADMDPFLAQLLTNPAAAEAAGAGPAHEHVGVMITPTPGVCVKTESKSGEKVFVNVCRSDQVPPPPPVTDAEMAYALANNDNSKYSVPMSVGAPHAELDTAKRGCTAYDVIVSEEAFAEFRSREGMREFMLELMLSHIEVKYDTLLSRDFKVLAKRKCMGQLQPQMVRRKKTIREVHAKPGGGATAPAPPPTRAAKGGIQEVPGGGDDGGGAAGAPEIPEYTLHKEPETGRPEFYIVEVHVPRVASASTMTLDVGGRRFELSAHPRRYFLGLDFEWAVDHTETGAQFNKTTRRLTVTLPVLQDQD